jgi:predicted nucleotidyltransferase
MRIDPKGTIAGYPALVVRQALQRLQFYLHWGVKDAVFAARLPAAEGRAFTEALVVAGLAEATGQEQWCITQTGKRLTSATAARPVSRATAEKALREFLDRVDEVNRNDHYLGRVSAVVLFGSMLRSEVDRLSDVDVAVEIVQKELDRERARAANECRARELEQKGHQFRQPLDWVTCWYREVFAFLKGRGRVISLANLRAEGELILAVPHQILRADPGWKPHTPKPPVELRPSPLPPDPDCPF